MKGLERLVLKQRQRVTRKWPLYYINLRGNKRKVKTKQKNKNKTKQKKNKNKTKSKAKRRKIPSCKGTLYIVLDYVMLLF